MAEVHLNEYKDYKVTQIGIIQMLAYWIWGFCL